MARSAKKTPRSNKTAGRLDHETLMAGSTKESFEPKQATERSEHEADIGEVSDDLEAFVQANEVIMNGMAALNSEMLAFGNKRLRENIERSESLVGCKDAEEAFRIQCDFAQSVTQQYLNQSNNLLTILAKMTQEFWAPLQEHTRKALRDLNKETQ
jgi:hypothetical protein